MQLTGKKDTPIEILSSDDENLDSLVPPPTTKKKTKKTCRNPTTPKKKQPTYLASEEDSSSDHLEFDLPTKRKSKSLSGNSRPVKRRKPNSFPTKKESKELDFPYGGIKMTLNSPSSTRRQPSCVSLSQKNKPRIKPPPAELSTKSPNSKRHFGGSVAHLFESEEEKESMRKQIADLQLEKENMKKEKQKVRSDYESLKLHLANKCDQVRQKNEQLQKSAEEVKRLEELLKNFESTKDQLQKAQASFEETKDSLRIKETALTAAQQSARQHSINLNTYKNERKQQIKQIEGLKKTIGKLDKMIKEKDDKLLKMGDVCNTLGQEKTKLTDKFNKLEKSFENAQRKLQNQLQQCSSNIKQKEEHLDQANKEIDKLKAEIDNIKHVQKGEANQKDVISRLETEKSQLESKLSNLQNLSSENEKKWKREEDRFRAEVAEIGCEVQTLNDEVLKTRVENESLKETVSNKDAEVTKYSILLENELKTRARANRSFQEERKMSQKKIHELTAERENLLQKLNIQNPETQLSDATVQAMKLQFEKDLQDSQDKVKLLSAKVQSLQSNQTKLQDALKKCEDQAKEISVLESEKKTMEANLKDLSKKVDSFRTEKMKLAKDHEHALAKVKTEKQRLEDRIKVLEEDKTKMIKQNKQDLDSLIAKHKKEMIMRENEHKKSIQELKDTLSLPRVQSLEEAGGPDVTRLRDENRKLKAQVQKQHERLSTMSTQSRNPSSSVPSAGQDKALLIKENADLKRQVKELQAKIQHTSAPIHQRDMIAMMDRQIKMEQIVLDQMHQIEILQGRWTVIRNMLRDVGVEIPEDHWREVFSDDFDRGKVSASMEWGATVEKLVPTPWTMKNYGKVLHHIETMYSFLSLDSKDLYELSKAASHPYIFFNKRLNELDKSLKDFVERSKRRFGEQNAARYEIHLPKKVDDRTMQYAVSYYSPHTKQAVLISDVALSEDDEKLAQLFSRTMLLRYLQRPEVLEKHQDRDILQVTAINMKELFYEIMQKLFQTNRNIAEGVRQDVEHIHKQFVKQYESRQHRLLYKKHGEVHEDFGKDPVPTRPDAAFCIKEILEQQKVPPDEKHDGYTKYLVEFAEAAPVWIKEKDLLYDDAGIFIERYKNPSLKNEPSL